MQWCGSDFIRCPGFGVGAREAVQLDRNLIFFARGQADLD